MGNHQWVATDTTGENTSKLWNCKQGCFEVETDGCTAFGSGQDGGSPTLADMGQPEEPQANLDTYPGFWGGAGDHGAATALSDDEETSPQMVGVQGPLSSLDYVVQNLQCRLGNPTNRCYANSAFRLWSWAGSFMEGPKLWNRTAQAVAEALDKDEVVQLTQLDGLRPLWTKFDDEQQNDASHFLQELVDLADSKVVILGHHLVDSNQRVHHRKVFPTHLIFPDQSGSEELEQLIGEWANTQEGQVFDGDGLWVAQIGRYRQVDGRWTKHHRPLRVPSIFNLPITLDGNSTRTKQYSVVGFLCHSGNERQHGHFYAVFLYRGMSWIVVDGAFPKAVAQITAETQCGRCHPNSYCRLTSSMTCSSRRKSRRCKRQCSEGLRFDFANITTMGQSVRQWLLSKPRQPTFVVETHLGAEDHVQTLQWMTARGYGALGEPAAESVKGGTHGGMMLLFPQNQHFHYVQKKILEGCGWYAVSWTLWRWHPRSDQR